MNKKELQNIISKGENEKVEFKESFNKQTIETLVAFANAKGGKVILGVTNKNEIVNVKLAKESIQTWQNEIKSKTEPSIFPDIEMYIISNKNVVILSIPEYPVKPIAFQGRYYVRRNNSNHLLSVNQINDVYLQSIQTSWDSYPYPNSVYEDLDQNKIKIFIEKINRSGRFNLVGEPIECIEKLRLLENNVPTNAAMILFAKDELFNNIHIGRFKTQSHIIDDKMVRGTLFDVVENTMKFIISHLKVAFEITGETTQRTEIFEYPITALREIVLNAV